MADSTLELQPRTWDWPDRNAKVHWVFGMRWLPALGSKGQKALQRNLREQGFAWAVNHGKQVRLIGVPPQAAAGIGNGKMASAAVAFATQHTQGMHALCLEVHGIGVWLVAASDGCVLSDTDRWFDTLEQAQAYVEGLRERHEQIAVLTSQWNPEGSGDEAKPPEFLQASLFKHCRFSRLPSLYLHSLWMLFGVAVLGAVGYVVVGWLPERDIEPEVPSQALSIQTVNPLAQVHSYAALQALLASWHDLPVDPEGWLLQSVACRIEGAKALCQAAYKRRKPDASNEGLLRHQPDGWLFEADSIERAFYKRAIGIPMQSLQPHLMTSTVFGLTQLQRLSPRVAGLSIGSPATLQMPDAVVASFDGQGFAQGSAAGAATRLSARSLTVRLALRHAQRIAELSLPLRWRQAELSVVHGAQIDTLHGYLMLNLQGDWLETR